ncbi:exportin-5 isoform X1 [Silurus meridionalis]|uniref:exportin-5 isoform X1 n=1 Tax=Silurus meridionalis TaxID=175797 RepID=UPI001EEA7AEE|nr:exportin-5 isoform X1 [Silurus meridionalis]
MAESVGAMCEQLVKAVTVMMDAESNQRYRLEALKFCEEFKEKCPYCIPCGLQLADKSQPAVVRHFGLQILEHVIKFQWNNMEQHEKVHLKDCAMEMLTNGTFPILEEESHIKDALSRIVVEMIKREWPQQWPDMLKEMETLTTFGDTQTELVMLILLRLAEDVITFQTLPQQRRRDIQHTLTQNMDGIFSFLLNILQQHVDEYRKLKINPGQELKAKAHCRVSVTTLNTLAGYIDWVALVHITNNSCHLLEILCLLLSEPELRLEAAECLLIAVSRKGKLEDRKPFMVLFKDVAMHYILSAAQSAEVGLSETRYTFLKRLCQVLCALGSQLCALVGSPAEVEVPANLSKYLEAFLAFTTHPSQFLRSCTQTTWGNMFRHEVLSKEPVITQMTVKYLNATMTNLVKTGFPSKNDSPTCDYARVDFDSDEDFNAFFHSFRAQQGDVIRHSCKIAPLEAFQIAAEWLKYQINSPSNSGNALSKPGEGTCSTFSPTAVQWEAMTFFTESVMGQLFKVLEKEKLPVDQGMELLQAVVSYETRDPVVLSCVLTNLSTFFPFVLHRPELLPQVFFKLFPAITFEVVEESKAPRTRAVKNVRRHACSSIIKMCRDYPEFILPSFDLLYTRVKELFINELLLTQMEKCALMEALVLISNQFKDYSKQKAFLVELMGAVTARWLSEEMRSVLSDPASFITFIGADQVNPQPGTEDQMGINRSRISFCVYTILGVVKRAHCPTDVEEAKAGGFVVGYTPAGAPIYRNPASEPLLALLPNLLTLIRTHNSLFLPENLARLSETFSRVYDVMDVEKNLILGITQPLLDMYDSPVYRSSLERLQGFFCTLYDNCYHVLGHAGPALLQDFYTIEGLAEQLAGSAFLHLEHVPDHRLRPMLRVFMKPLVTSCPPEYYETLLCPLLRLLLCHLLQRLNLRWQIINQRTSVCGPDDDEAYEENQVSQEMLEDRLVRLVTREVMDLLSVSCISRKLPESGANREDADGDEEMMATDSTPLNTSHTSDELTELGKCLLKHEDVYMNLLAISFNSLSWRDTSNCQRAATLICWTLLRQVVGSNLLPDAVTWLYTRVLSGLQMHGQHEGCNAALTQLALLIYDALRPQYAELRSIMNQIPNIQPDLLEQFDQKTINPALQKIGEKKRKDQFKKLIAGAVGKPLGQQFKKEVHIRNLPSLFKKVKPNKDVVANSENTGLVALFSPEHDDH